MRDQPVVSGVLPLLAVARHVGDRARIRSPDNAALRPVMPAPTGVIRGVRQATQGRPAVATNQADRTTDVRRCRIRRVTSDSGR